MTKAVDIDGLGPLGGRGGVAAEIRDHPWDDHPLGPPGTWDPALRTMLAFCLDTRFPAALFWGPDFRMLTNDAFRAAFGRRAPGVPAAEATGLLWQTLEGPLTLAMETGEGQALVNHPVAIDRSGAPQWTTWSFSLVPVRLADGRVGGVHATARESTDETQARIRSEVLLALSGTGRDGQGVSETLSGTMRVLGQAFGVDRAGIGERIAGESFRIAAEYVAPGNETLGEQVMLRDFGEAQAGVLAAGRMLRIDDVTTDARFSAEARATYAGAGIRASLVVPWIEAGELLGSMFLCQSTPRAWSATEIATVEDLLARIRLLIERERASDRERRLVREIDHRARNALAVAQSTVRLTAADGMDAFRDAVEQRIGVLAAAHALLADAGWTEVPFGRLLDIGIALASPAAEVRRSGDPHDVLPAETVQPVALALHEMLLGGDTALPASIAWHRDETGFHIHWQETRGATPSTLARRLIEGQVHGTFETGEDGWRITLPLAGKGARPGAGPVGIATAGTPAPARGLRVMIVEDEALIAMDLEATIEALGHDVVGVPSRLSDAMDRLAVVRPDVALLDGNLRGESSVPLAVTLHGMGVPVIFVTGYERIDQLPEELAGAPVLTKPVSEPALAAALSRVSERGAGA